MNRNNAVSAMQERAAMETDIDLADRSYFDRDGKPITYADWAVLYGDSVYRRLAYDEIGEAIVSTIWIGMNHNWIGKEPIQIFETIVIPGDKIDRYATEAESFDGHARTVERVTSNPPKWFGQAD